MKEPVDHILRPRLPWRQPTDPAITECGYNAASVKTLSREEFFAREKELGSRRSMMLTCMTCRDTASRWGTWDDDPRLAMQREVEWERRDAYYRCNAPNERGTLLKDELVAINLLIQAHRGEFDAHLIEIAGRREWNEKKEARATKPKPPKSSGGGFVL